MDYQLYELGRALLEPVGHAASLGRAALSPFAEPLPQMRPVLAGLELVERASRRYDKPPFGIDRVRTADGGTAEVLPRIAARRRFCDLLHFEKSTREKGPRVLLVAPLSGHHASLLRDTLAGLLERHDVFVTDWRDARDVPVAQGTFHLDDYVEDLLVFLRLLGPRPIAIAVCQPTVPLLAAASLLAEAKDPARPRAMVLMGGPVDVAAAPTAVTRYAQSRPLSWFETHVIRTVPARYPGRGRRVYPGHLQLAAFMAMNLDRHARSHAELWQDVALGREIEAARKRAFYDDYLAVLDMDAPYYLETLARVFQRRELATGRFRWRGEAVRPEAVGDIATLVVEGGRDDISAPGQTLAALDLLRGLPARLKAHHLEPEAGHYGIFSGTRWRGSVLPRIERFIAGLP